MRRVAACAVVGALTAGGLVPILAAQPVGADPLPPEYHLVATSRAWSVDAVAVNSSGVAIGTASGGGNHRITSSGAEPIASLPGESGLYLRTIADGGVAVGSSWSSSAPNRAAFVAAGASVASTVPDVPGESTAMDANTSGTIVGMSRPRRRGPCLQLRRHDHRHAQHPRRGQHRGLADQRCRDHRGDVPRCRGEPRLVRWVGGVDPGPRRARGRRHLPHRPRRGRTRHRCAQ